MSEAQFFRVYKAEFKISGKIKGLQINIGARGKIEPDTGMSVSLPLLDASAAQFLKGFLDRSYSDIPELLKTIWQFFSTQFSLSRISCVDGAEEFLMKSAAEVKCLSVFREEMQIAGQWRLLGFAGASRAAFPERSFSQVRELLLHLQKQNWLGEVRDELNEKTYSLI